MTGNLGFPQLRFFAETASETASYDPQITPMSFLTSPATMRSKQWVRMILFVRFVEGKVSVIQHHAAGDAVLEMTFAA